MTDLTSDLEGIGMPFVSLREYATKMLFTGQNVVPDTEDEQVRKVTSTVYMKYVIQNELLDSAFCLL